jgi:hypothetical protein
MLLRHENGRVPWGLYYTNNLCSFGIAGMLMYYNGCHGAAVERPFCLFKNWIFGRFLGRWSRSALCLCVLMLSDWTIPGVRADVRAECCWFCFWRWPKIHHVLAVGAVDFPCAKCKQGKAAGNLLLVVVVSRVLHLFASCVQWIWTGRRRTLKWSLSLWRRRREYRPKAEVRLPFPPHWNRITPLLGGLEMARHFNYIIIVVGGGQCSALLSWRACVISPPCVY